MKINSKIDIINLAIIFVFIFSFSKINSQWTLDAILPVDSINNPVVQKVCVIDSSLSWIFAIKSIIEQYPILYRRTKAGWHKVNNDLNYSIEGRCVAAVDSSNVYLGTFHPSQIYYSSNGGINWNLQYHIADTGHVVGITFCKQNNNVGYAFCHLATNTMWNGVCILKTTNGGQNWSRWNFAYYGYKAADNSMCIIDSNNAWFGADDVLSGTSKIINTSNGGLTWNVRDINAGNGAPFTIQFYDDSQTGLFVGQTSPISWFYRTSNAGLNWNIVYTTSYYYSKTMVWVPGTSNIYGNSEFNLVRSLNSGVNWYTMYGGPGTSLESMDAVRINQSTIYALAVTYDRRVYKLLDTVRVIGTENIGTAIPKAYNLYQNYPNPFNPVTNISFSIPKAGFTSIRIYDINGRLVQTLFETQLAPGSYKADWNASQMPSGIYIYRIESGSFTQSRKMILVK